MNARSIDSPVASGARQRTWARSGAVLCHGRPPPRQRQPSAPRHPAARPEPWPSASQESREATAATRHAAQDKKKPPSFLLCVPSDPIRRTDLTSNRAHATMRGREGAFSQTKAARRRAAVSVDLTPERTEPRVSTSPRPPTCVRIVAGAVPTPTVPWQNPVWWSAWLPPRVRMQTVVSLIQQWLCLTRKDLRK